MSKKSVITFSIFLLTAGAITQSEAAVPAPSIDVIALRAETRQLEQDMYNIFNALNSSDEFDVTCGEQRVTGSTIPEWQCDAAFMRNARARDTSTRFDNPLGGAANTQNGYIPQSGRQLSFKNRKKTQQLNDEMMALARQHAELASAMIAFNNKRQQLEQLEK